MQLIARNKAIHRKQVFVLVARIPQRSQCQLGWRLHTLLNKQVSPCPKLISWPVVMVLAGRYAEQHRLSLRFRRAVAMGLVAANVAIYLHMDT